MGDNDTKNTFQKIWDSYSHRQNRFSSYWWFFLLFPEGENCYGAEQLMVVLAGNTKKKFKFNGEYAEPMNTSVEEDKEQFNAAISGWYSNEEEVVELINDNSRAELSPHGLLDTSKHSENDDGLRIKSRSENEGFDVKLRNDETHLEFQSYPKIEEDEWPKEALDTQKLGLGANLINWSNKKFEGNLRIDGEPREIEGIGYFQRVSLDVPGMPWKWIHTVFPNGDIFIGFIPFIGPHILRKKYKFFQSEALENISYPVKATGTWIKGETGETVKFDKTRIRVQPKNDGHPKFKVKATKKGEGKMEFTVNTRNHIENNVKSPILKGLTHSRYTYNEYTFSVENFNTTIKDIEVENPENGHGNIEYSYGLWI